MPNSPAGSIRASWSPSERAPAAATREFAPEQLERVYVLKSLHSKGVRLSQLARVPLDLDGEYVIFDGKGKVLRTCPDAESAIRAVVSGKGRHPGHTITILGRGNPGRG